MTGPRRTNANALPHAAGLPRKPAAIMLSSSINRKRLLGFTALARTRGSRRTARR